MEIACRPTGGGWLLHLPGDIALTFCVAGPLGAGAFRLTARHIAHAIAAGCSTNDRDAVVFTGLSIPASREEVCFERADRDEVVLGDVKVAGVALARLGRSALVQTAVPLMSPGDANIRSFARRFDAMREAASAALAGRDSESIVAATIDALSRRLNVPLVEWSWQPVSDERSSGQP
ncbi:MAG: hypothetical protein HC882_08845 [Acidobacteria bacterium]|nr:hypothetical protein [Acidobacteriota bacterium]